MGEGLKFYDSDDATASVPYAFPSTAAGATSAAIERHLWNEKGSLTGNSPRNLRLRLVVEISAGVWQETGDPLVDRRELQMRIIGGQNPNADPLFVTPSAGPWQSIGAGTLFECGNMTPDTAVNMELRYAPSIIGGSGTIAKSWRLDPVYDQWAEAFDSNDIGILTGCGETSISEWVTAPAVTPTATPDDVVHLGLSWWVGLGVSRRADVSTVTLNQNDSAVAALAAGQAYEALLSQPAVGGAVVATKGVKAAAGSTVLPALPAGNIAIAHVHVAYQAGGTSVIDTADITQLADDGRGEIAYSASSFDVTVGRLRALSGSTFIDRPAGALTLDPSVTSTIYLGADGALATTATRGALALWEAVTDGSGVTAVTDLRTFVGGRRLVLRQQGTAATATAADWTTATEESAIDRLDVTVRVASSGGATGSTIVDIKKEGTTLFTTAGLKPAIAAGARTVTAGTNWPQVTTLAKGEALTLDVAPTTGGTQEKDVEVIVWLYPKP